MNTMSQKKSHALTITIIIIVLILAGIGFYFWQKQNGQSPTATTPVSSVTPTPQVQALLNGTTTAEQDLSTDVLNGTNVDLTSGISQ